MAGSFEHLRNCLCGLSASHLRSLTQSSDISKVECRFRVLAIRGMITELKQICKRPEACQAGQTEALVAATTMMAWYTPEPFVPLKLMALMRELICLIFF
jgi:hypothetical protein